MTTPEYLTVIFTHGSNGARQTPLAIPGAVAKRENKKAFANFSDFVGVLITDHPVTGAEIGTAREKMLKSKEKKQ